MHLPGIISTLRWRGTTTGGGGGGGTYFASPVSGKINDDGHYDGFPFPAQLHNGKLISIYKKADSHVDKGPMTLAKSINGGASWTEAQIKVGGVGIQCAALSMVVLSSGRIVIGYQDDTLYTSLKFAYSDDEGASFTASGSVLTNGTGLSFSPVKMRVLPSGKILCGYYTGYGAGEDAQIGFCVSTNSGSTWSFGPTIFTHAGTGFGDNKGYEFGFEIIDNTGTDSTCKMIALVRNADAGPYMHYKSTDGGTTWTTDTVTTDPPGSYSRHYLYNFGGYSNQAPVDIFLHNGLVYVITGYRDSSGGSSFKLQYITASVTDALTNNFYNWSSVLTVLTTAQNDVNFGYPLAFEVKSTATDTTPGLWLHYYDVSELANNGLGTPRCFVKQVQCAAP
jgi:hypothetical protein